MSGRAQVVEADLTWTGRAFEPGVRVEVDERGSIAGVGRLAAPPTRRLERCALLPGFVNAHSHAFQRGLRGRGETFAAGAGSFWSWREAMYELVAGLDPAAARTLSARAFAEMRDAGITTVGEFHYVRHGRDAGADFALDEAVRAAAADVGIRLVLMPAHYVRGGFDGRPLEGGQRRFDDRDLDTYWARMDALAASLDPDTQTLGAVGHSTRAVPIDDLAALHAEADRRGLVLHLHLEEQPREIEDCRAVHGVTPMGLLLEHGVGGRGVTAVHCTHTRPEEMVAWVERGGAVCLCPLTEANLGDGLADVPTMLESNATISLGTDSNARISMLEEMRWMEYGQRLRTESRGVVVDPAGDVATPLLRFATEEGARCLGVPAGRIAPGRHADLAVIDLDAPCLAGAEPETLAAALVLGAGDDVVLETCVGGRWRPRGTASGAPAPA